MNEKKSPFLRFLSILFLCFVGFDRFNFFNGITDIFRLTFPLALSVLLNISFVFYLPKFKFKELDKDVVRYIVFLFVFMAIILTSCILSNNVKLSLTRFVLMGNYMAAGLIACYFIMSQENYKQTLIGIALFGTFANLAAMAVEFLIWSGKVPLEYFDKFWFFNNWDIWPGFEGMRFAGLSNDQNRCAFLLILCQLAIMYNCKKKFTEYFFLILNSVMVIMTGSRTAIGCLVLGLLVYAIDFFRRDKKALWKLMALLVVFVAAIFIVPAAKETALVLFKRFAETVEAEGQDVHFALIITGIKVAFGGLKNFLIGNGFAASANVLQEYGLLERYANFHCAYVSFLAESGVFAFLGFIYALLRPCVKYKRIFAGILVIAFANFTYQIHFEPYFWAVVAFYFCYGERYKQNR